MCLSSFFKLQETIKHLQEEVSCIEEAQGVFRTFSDWLSTAQNNFSTVAISVDVVDRFAMERKMKKLEVHSNTEHIPSVYYCMIC